MQEKEAIYLDNAATSRVSREVYESMEPFFHTYYHNAAALYKNSENAKSSIETGRQQVAGLLGTSPEEIYFTSGGTESINWAIIGTIFRTGKKHIISSSIEHHAVLKTLKYLEQRAGCEITLLPVDETGLVQPDDLEIAIRKDTGIITIMHANNEVGTIQPIERLAKIAHERNILFHTDAVQTAGKIPINVYGLGIDMLSISGHKFHGPKGIGALYIHKNVAVDCYMHGGGQENEMRSGTSNVPGIVGIGKASEIACKKMDIERQRQQKLVEHLWDGLNQNIPKIKETATKKSVSQGF